MYEVMTNQKNEKICILKWSTKIHEAPKQLITKAVSIFVKTETLDH